MGVEGTKLRIGLWWECCNCINLMICHLWICDLLCMLLSCIKGPKLALLEWRSAKCGVNENESKVKMFNSECHRVNSMDNASFVQIIAGSGFLKKIRIKELLFLDISKTSNNQWLYRRFFGDLCLYTRTGSLLFSKHWLWTWRLITTGGLFLFLISPQQGWWSDC